MTKRRILTEQDRHAWANYVQHVVPLVGGTALPPAVAPELAKPELAAAPVAAVAQRPTPAPRASLARLEVGTAPGGVDRSTWSRFRTGKLAASRTLDLHGRTLQLAYGELHAFLGHAVAERLRCVEVITGRGSGETGGAIRREFPLWINSPALRPLVLAASHPHAANPGSVRLLLRRVR